MKTGEQDTRNEELYRAFDGEGRDKKMYFFLLPPLSSHPAAVPLCVRHGGGTGRSPHRAAHNSCSLLTLTGGGAELQHPLTCPAETITYGPEWPSIRHRSLRELQGDARRGKRRSFCDAQWVTHAKKRYQELGLLFLPASHVRKIHRYCRNLRESVTLSVENAVPCSNNNSRNQYRNNT